MALSVGCGQALAIYEYKNIDPEREALEPSLNLPPQRPVQDLFHEVAIPAGKVLPEGDELSNEIQKLGAEVTWKLGDQGPVIGYLREKIKRANGLLVGDQHLILRASWQGQPEVHTPPASLASEPAEANLQFHALAREMPGCDHQTPVEDLCLWVLMLHQNGKLSCNDFSLRSQAKR